VGEKNNGKPRQPRRSEIQAMGMSAGVVFSAGFSLVFSAFAGLAIGIALDRRGGRTLFAPIGLLLGLLAGFHRLYVAFRVVAKRKVR
jgi:F0F1-type ATP synthase assembly protein I